jgi:hypothetical protein
MKAFQIVWHLLVLTTFAQGDSSLLPQSKLLAQMEKFVPSEGQLMLSFEMHPSFQTPIIWLIHEQGDALIISVERYANVQTEIPEISLEIRVKTEPDQTLIKFAHRMREQASTTVAGLDTAISFVQIKETGKPAFAKRVSLYEVPSDASEKGTHRTEKEAVAWLIETTGIKPRPSLPPFAGGNDRNKKTE